MSIEESIVDTYISRLSEKYELITGKKYPKSKHAMIRRSVKKTLKNDEVYKSFSWKNGVLDKAVIAFANDNPLVGKCIYIEMLYIASGLKITDLIKDELEGLKSFFKKPYRKVMVSLPSSEQKMIDVLNKSGTEVHAYLTLGSVDYGLKVLTKKIKKYNFEEYEISPMSYKLDITKIIDIEKKAHAYDKSSTVKNYNKKLVEMDKQYFIKICKDRSAWKLTHKNKTIGVISIYNDYYSKGIPIIHSISILPKYQGKGLANLLYHHILTYMKNNNNKRYLGFSSTSSVLGLGKVMKREIIEYCLKE